MSTFLRFACSTVLFGACIGFAAPSVAKSSKFKEVKIASVRKPADKLSGGLNVQKFAPQPLQIFISLNSQRMSVYRGLTRIKSSRISSGKKGHATPRGIFSVIEKKKYHESNLYNNAPMPYMQRLTWSGIALHQGQVPGYPASHGCIRMPKKFASSVFKQSNYRDHVIISPEEITPRAVSHPTLFQPRIDREKTFALRGTKDELGFSFGAQNSPTGKEPLRIYITRTSEHDMVKAVQEMLGTLRYYNGKISGRLNQSTLKSLNKFQSEYNLKKSKHPNAETLAVLAKWTFRKKPALGHLYVRQKYLPLFDYPIEINSPEKPLGSHLFVTYNFSKLNTKWIGSTISTKIPYSIRKAHGLDKSSKKRVYGTFTDALDRIVIPDEAKNRIEKLLSAGSSIAISDNGIGNETGKGTDFIVQTH